MKPIDSFFTRVSSAEEALPKAWLTATLPPPAKKRKVGRPKKEPVVVPVPEPVPEPAAVEKQPLCILNKIVEYDPAAVLSLVPH